MYETVIKIILLKLRYIFGEIQYFACTYVREEGKITMEYNTKNGENMNVKVQAGDYFFLF